MLSRRELLSAAVIGSAPGVPGVEAGQDTDLREVTRVLEGIRDELRAERTTCAAAICPGVSQLRRLQRVFLKGNRKYPDFIDVGIELWEEVHDWHLETRQAVAIGRQPDGFYTLAFGPTTLLLKPEAPDDFVGFPYDNL